MFPTDLSLIWIFILLLLCLILFFILFRLLCFMFIENLICVDHCIISYVFIICYIVCGFVVQVTMILTLLNHHLHFFYLWVLDYVNFVILSFIKIGILWYIWWELVEFLPLRCLVWDRYRVHLMIMIVHLRLCCTGCWHSFCLSDISSNCAYF